MDFRILEFIVVLAFVQWIGSLPLSCLYNGMSHREGETVRTDEPCLSCICQSGALECSLRVCAEYPRVLPPGCFLLHKPNHCCPQIFCDKNFGPVGVELKTNFRSENKLHENDCIINGSIYGEGSAVASSQPCEYCYCVGGDIKCLKPRCSHSFDGCKAIYETSSCCPTHYDCRESNVSFFTSQMKNFVSADINITVSNDSLRSHLNLDLEHEKGDLNVRENAETDLNKTEGKLIGESTTTITEKRNTEETTMAPIQNSTIPMVEDYLTTLDFQTMKAVNFSKESGIIAFTEDSTREMLVNGNASLLIKENIEEPSEIQMQRTLDSFKEIKSSMGSHDESCDNASQEIVEYDSYDYSEPHLPPSLPNLVIFPFVAADAVIKGGSTGEPDSYDKDQIGKISTRRVFYKDYFSPPIKSEGGFVPKKPSKSEEPLYEQAYLSREQVQLSDEGVKGNAVAASQANSFSQEPNEMKFSAFSDIKETNATSADGLDSVLNVTVDPLFEDTVQPDLETPPGFQLRADDETTTFYENKQTKKPVTVTFKNFVVDFYPNYLITSKRVQFEPETQTTTKENFSKQKSQDVGTSLNPISDPSFNFYDEVNTSVLSDARRENPVMMTVSPLGGKIFFSNKFTHSFLSEETSATMTTTAITSTNKKHKFSSKIKNQLITTVKPKREKISQKVEQEVDTSNLSTESYSVLTEDFAESFSTADEQKNHNEKRKLIKAEETTRFIETVEPLEMKNEKVELSVSLSGENASNVKGKPDLAATMGGDNCVTSKAGTLLKLAGCNIYGMMYRVGKVIAELSGPCLECLCTDFGVQCKPLKC